MTTTAPSLMNVYEGWDRHQLYDIDVIINRTLVYTTLTVLLALLYFGLVIALQSLMHVFTEQLSSSPPIFVTSTLAIAALSYPLPRSIAIFGETDVLDSGAQSLCQTGRGFNEVCKPFCEYFTGTIGVAAKELSDGEHQSNGTTCARQILGMSAVRAVDGRRRHRTVRAR